MTLALEDMLINPDNNRPKCDWYVTSEKFKLHDIDLFF